MVWGNKKVSSLECALISEVLTSENVCTVG